MICSFVPRLYDYHPKAIPAPYNHSNIDSDEVLYYVDGDFMSRDNIEQGHITLHRKEFRTDLLREQWSVVFVGKRSFKVAVIGKYFRPLQVTEAAMKMDDGKYYKSWVE